MRYRGRKKGSQRTTYDKVRPTRFLPPEYAPMEDWRSPVNQRLIREDLFEFKNESVVPYSPMLHFAVQQARTAFKIPGGVKVKMMHLIDVFREDLPIWSRSPGLPWKDVGYKTNADIRDDPDAVNSVRKFWHYVKLGEKMNPPDCCAFVRSHKTKYPETKVRAIWEYPATMTFGEAVFAVPLIKAYQKGNSPLAYGLEVGNGGFRRLKNDFTTYRHYLGLDFRKFDKTVPAWLIEKAFIILAYNIDFTHYGEYGVPDAHKMWRMFEYIQNYFINTTIRLANGDRFQKNSGVASGSYFTLLIDLIVNYILGTWFSLEQKVMGDEFFVGCTKKPDMDQMQLLAKSIGMEINIAKSCQYIKYSDIVRLEIGMLTQLVLLVESFDKWQHSWNNLSSNLPE